MRTLIAFVVVLAVAAACGEPPPPPPPPPLPGTWTARAPLATARSELGAALVDGKIYAVGGLAPSIGASTVVEIYDPSADAWTQGPPLPAARHHAGVAAANGKLYVLGGYGPGPYPWTHSVAATVFEFDPGTRAWSSRSEMPQARAAFTATAVGTKIHCIGGLRGTEHTVYDVAEDSWTVLPDMPTPREHLASAAIGSTVYVVGGRVTKDPKNFGETTDNSAALEAWDTATGTWTTLAPMKLARGGLAAASLDGKLYAMGGEYPDVFVHLEEYDPQTGEWRLMRHMQTPRHGLAAVTTGGAIYAIGGGPSFGFSYSAANESFTPQ